MKKNKYIALLFLIINSIVIGHAIVPHHHHLNHDNTTNCETSHNDIHNQIDNHGDETHHCHAFNTTKWFNERHSRIFPSIDQFIDIPTWRSNIFLECYRDLNNYNDYKFVYSNPLRHSNQLRGPPTSISI